MSGPKDSKLDEKIEELDALFEKIEKLVEEGATEEAIALSKKASMISKELKREETEEVIQVGAGEFGDLKDSEILSERKGALSEVKSLVKGGSTEEAIKRIELAAKLTDEMKERNTRANLESERKEVLGEVKSLVKGGSTEEAIKRIELAAKLTDRMKRRPSPSVASESIKIEYPPKIKEELEKPEIIPAPMKREPPITDVGLAKKIIAASFSPHKDIRYVTDNPFIEEAVLIVGICSILVATGGVLSGATITVNETITSIVYVFILWVAIAGASHMISTALRGGGEFHPQMTTLIGFSTIPICIGYAIYMMAPYGVIIPIAVIWSVIISFFGVKESRNLTSTKSVISAGASLLWLLLLL